MFDKVQVIGNGKQSQLFKPLKAARLVCNIPPFAIPNVYATCICDFKMMIAIAKREITVPGDWVLGARPRKFCDDNPMFHIEYSSQIKRFYTILPPYAGNYRDFSTGHMAVHFAANALKGKEVHLYGFDSLFDLDVFSTTDLVLPSNRDDGINNQLIYNWRPIWNGIFREFPNTKFVLHHIHDNIKIEVSDNVVIETP